MEIQSVNSIQQVYSLSMLPKRVKGSFNSSFKSLSITTNFHKAQFKNINQIFAFKICFNPKIIFNNTILRNDLINKALPQISQFIKTPVISGFTIYTSTPPLKSQETIRVDYQDVQYSILIKQIKNIQLTDSLKIKFIESFFNNFLRGMMRARNYVQIGRTNKFFNIQNKKDIDSLVMFSGYKANFQFLENGLYLRVNTAKKFVRRDTVLNKINELYRLHKDKSKDQKRDIVKSNLVGQTVMTNYGKTAYYRIVEIIYTPMEQITFKSQDQTIKIKDYFKKKYGINFSQNQPLIQVETKNKTNQVTYLIPQLCQMTGIPQDFDEQRRKKISQATIRSSDQRKKDIEGLIQEIVKTQGFSALQHLGVKINPKLHTINSRVISNPKLQLGKNNTVEDGKESFFNLFSKPIYASKHQIKLGAIFFESTDIFFQVKKTIEETSKNLNASVQMTQMPAGPFEGRKALEIIENLIQKSISKKLNIVLIICPNIMKKDYGKIKQICLKKSKILCQFALQNTFKRKGAQSIITKILLQLIAKRGNTLWVPKTKFKHNNCMLMSFDNSKIKNGKSLMAVVASVNSTFSSLYSKCEQFSNQDDKYHAMFKLYLKALQYYKDRNKQFPKDIIILQNAVPKDQVQLIKDFFIKSVSQNQKVKDISQAKPNLIFIMVNTKNDERFFDGPQNRNPRAGTVVSEQIVGNNFDFYMISQYTTRGSSIPNHYDVVYNDSKMQEGVIHQLLFSQCFNYVNWTGSIKVPGVLQYVKKCVKFHAEVLEGAYISSDMEGKLYYV